MNFTNSLCSLVSQLQRVEIADRVSQFLNTPCMLPIHREGTQTAKTILKK